MRDIAKYCPECGSTLIIEKKYTEEKGYDMFTGKKKPDWTHIQYCPNKDWLTMLIRFED